MVSPYNAPGDNLTKADKVEGKSCRPACNDAIQYLNFGEDDQMEIQGFAFSQLKAHLCLILHVATLGILRLVFHWYPIWQLKATHRRCDLVQAEKALITDAYNGKASTHFVKRILTLNGDGTNNLLKFRLADGQTKERHQVRLLRCKKLAYIWDEDRQRFIKLAGLEHGITRSLLHDFQGQTEDEQLRKRRVYGNNEIVTPEQTVLQLLVLEALTPFYMFQLFSLLVWVAEQYYYYAVAIVLMSVVGIATSIVQTRRNQRNLKGTVNFISTVTVSRGNGAYDQISTTHLVPGDVIVVPQQGCEMYCDAVLLSGSCIVNESMLTGESVPVTKTPLDHHDAPYSLKEDVNHTLFCGTKVIQIRTQENEQLLAVVIRTGFLTTKGELVRSILYPPPADFKFDRDSYKYIGILAVIALLGVIYTVVSKSSRQIAAADIAIKALDIITIVIPPALPAAMTVGKLFALHRLKVSNIFCINSRVINVSGSVDCVCFDKTGTLTEDALDMWGVVPIENQQIRAPVKEVRALPTSTELLRCLASCHSLTSIDGRIAGDPLDVKMFESTHWIFEDNHYHGRSYGGFTPLTIVRAPEKDSNNVLEEIGIVKQFQFTSALQRMSVIVRSPQRPQFEVFCKGSPEKVISLSQADSVPPSIHRKLREYTEQGYRVIGVATKVLAADLRHEDIVKVHRDAVETDLRFLGLLVLENRLKPETTPVINTLKEAQLKVVMITGDNIQTAVTVARECRIIDEDLTVVEILTGEPTKHEPASISYHVITPPHSPIANGNGHDVESGAETSRRYCFVITGQSYATVVKHFPHLIPKIMTMGAVFARMTGSQKQHLVEQLKNLGYYVAMCGDGANDCGALKAAHVGISLSEAESSVASPFTSKEANIACTPKVIKEGRAALVTSFGVFQMMLCYSLTEFTSVIILYGIDSNLSSLQFLFIDICLILNFAATFGRTQAYAKLAKQPPRTSLMSFSPMCSMGLFMVAAAAAQTFAYYYVQTFKWFVPFEYDPSSAGIATFAPSYENYAVFCTSTFQYVTMAVVFSKGKPYRKHIFTNRVFVLCLMGMTVICGYMTLFAPHWLAEEMELEMPPAMDGRLMCVYVGAATFALCYFVQCFLVEVVLERLMARCVTKKKKQYLEIAKGAQGEPLWALDAPEKVSAVSENGRNGVQNNGFIS